MKYYAYVGYNKSSDTPFVPVSGPQGLQEAHGLHLLVPGAGAVGARSYPIKYSASVGYNKSSDTPFVPVRTHIAYTSWSLLLVQWMLGPIQ